MMRAGKGSRVGEEPASLNRIAEVVWNRSARKNILQQYGVGPIQFTGTNDALYERHLTFDHVVDVKKADVREQFEAAAHSIRDIISQRWLQTEDTYEQKNPKRVYYLSMEFLLGRSLRQQHDQCIAPPIGVGGREKEGT